ncbi:MAG: hypothetical protein JW878_03730 [Methanomicrobia archaeon]|nr:hypothetical protein [Methanomicrobia archaeon]
MKTEEARTAHEYFIGLFAGLWSGIIVSVINVMVEREASIWVAVPVVFVAAVIMAFIGWGMVKFLILRDP